MDRHSVSGGGGLPIGRCSVDSVCQIHVHLEMKKMEHFISTCTSMRTEGSLAVILYLQ